MGGGADSGWLLAAGRGRIGLGVGSWAGSGRGRGRDRGRVRGRGRARVAARRFRAASRFLLLLPIADGQRARRDRRCQHATLRAGWTSRRDSWRGRSVLVTGGAVRHRARHRPGVRRGGGADVVVHPARRALHSAAGIRPAEPAPPQLECTTTSAPARRTPGDGRPMRTAPPVTSTERPASCPAARPSGASVALTAAVAPSTLPIAMVRGARSATRPRNRRAATRARPRPRPAHDLDLTSTRPRHTPTPSPDSDRASRQQPANPLRPHLSARLRCSIRPRRAGCCSSSCAFPTSAWWLCTAGSCTRGISARGPCRRSVARTADEYWPAKDVRPHLGRCGPRGAAGPGARIAEMTAAIWAAGSPATPAASTWPASRGARCSRGRAERGMASRHRRRGARAGPPAQQKKPRGSSAAGSEAGRGKREARRARRARSGKR